MAATDLLYVSIRNYASMVVNAEAAHTLSITDGAAAADSVTAPDSALTADGATTAVDLVVSVVSVVSVDAGEDVPVRPLCLGQPMPGTATSTIGECPDPARMSACMTCQGLAGSPGCLSLCSFYSNCWECLANGWVMSSVDCPRNCGDAGVIQPGAIDAPNTDMVTDASTVDARGCRGAHSELATSGWVQPCSSLVDAGVPSLACAGRSPGLRVFTSFCGQREVVVWSWGTHAQTCFYEQESLVGVQLQNDTPAFCDNTSNTMTVGSTDGCPSSVVTPVLNCDPFTDSDWVPWSPDAR